MKYPKKWLGPYRSPLILFRNNYLFLFKYLMFYTSKGGSHIIQDRPGTIMYLYSTSLWRLKLQSRWRLARWTYRFIHWSSDGSWSFWDRMQNLQLFCGVHMGGREKKEGKKKGRKALSSVVGKCIAGVMCTRRRNVHSPFHGVHTGGTTLEIVRLEPYRHLSVSGRGLKCSCEGLKSLKSVSGFDGADPARYIYLKMVIRSKSLYSLQSSCYTFGTPTAF